jgi:alpha-glucosidase
MGQRLWMIVGLIAALVGVSASLGQEVATLRPLREAGADEPQPYFAQNFGGWVTRYFEDEAAVLQGTPSAVLIREPRHVQALTADVPVRPVFASEGRIKRVELPLPPGASAYGLGTAPGGVLRNGFAGVARPLQGIVLVVLSDGSAYAALIDTTAAVRVSLAESLQFEAEAETLPVVIAAGDSAMTVLSTVADLTGHMEMPPRWALGFGVVADDAGQAMKLVESAAGRVASAWLRNPTPGPELERLSLAAAEKGVRLGAMLDPLAASAAHQREEAEPGALAFADEEQVIADVTGPEGVKWWRNGIGSLRSAGISGVLLGWPCELPAVEANFAGAEWWGPGGMSRYGPLLPRLYKAATRSGIAPDEHGERPLVHSTSWKIGSQRFGGVLVEAGDDAVRKVLALSISGAPLVGIRGGSVEDLATAIVAMPLAVGVPGEEGRISGDLELLEELLEVRTQLVPYLYTLTFNAFFTGQPIVRPVFMAEPENPELRDIDWAYLLGGDLLVVPRGNDGSRPPSPLSGWRKLDLGAEHKDGDRRTKLGDAMPDLYLRPGSILPLATPEQVLGEATSPLVLLVNLDERGEAWQALYEDEGDGYGFYRNICRRIAHRVEVQGEHAYVRLAQMDGGWGMPERPLLVRILTDEGTIEAEGSERGTIRVPLEAPSGR